MSLRADIEDTYRTRFQGKLDPDVALDARHCHLVNTIKRLVTPAKLDKMSDEKLFKLLDLLEQE